MIEPNQVVKVESRFSAERYTRCKSEGVARGQKGFTLIELMIVVAIIGALAAMAVTFFGGTQRKTKARAEVMSLFAEFSIRQEQAMLEGRSYLPCGPGDTEDAVHPAVSLGNGNPNNILPLPAEWLTLQINPNKTSLVCRYSCQTGVAGDDASVGTIGALFGFGGVSPVPATEPWYYLIAQCDMDSNPADASTYFQYSGDSQLYFNNQGL